MVDMQSLLSKAVNSRGQVDLVDMQPLLSKGVNSRGQVDLVDMQSMPDGDFKFIMHCQDHLTKFSVLRALTSKCMYTYVYLRYLPYLNAIKYIIYSSYRFNQCSNISSVVKLVY